jgi:hypothetical protein
MPYLYDTQNIGTIFQLCDIQDWVTAMNIKAYMSSVMGYHVDW